MVRRLDGALLSSPDPAALQSERNATPFLSFTREGACSKCPAGAAACQDLTGEVTECRAGLGLVGGECRPCKAEGCKKCDGEWASGGSAGRRCAAAWLPPLATCQQHHLLIRCRGPLDLHAMNHTAGIQQRGLLPGRGDGNLVSPAASLAGVLAAGRLSAPHGCMHLPVHALLGTQPL